MDSSCWHAYVAGFFDGEGSNSIARNRVNGRSDYHKLIVTISQRAKHRQVLDEIQAEFGGAIVLREQPTRVSKVWAEQAIWQLQDKRSIERFLVTMQPYVRIKAPQVALGLEFLRTFQRARVMRDSLGRIQGTMLDRAEIERREQLRLAMREANELGPPHVKPSTLPPLDLVHRDRSNDKIEANPATIMRGERHVRAKLTEQAVRDICADYATGVTQSQLALQHGVSMMLINGIVHGKRWRHVTAALKPPPS